MAETVRDLHKYAQTGKDWQKMIQMARKLAQTGRYWNNLAQF